MDYIRLGDNCEYSMDDKVLTIRVKLDVQGARSASGKSIVLASTRGNTNVNGVVVGLNVYKKA